MFPNYVRTPGQTPEGQGAWRRSAHAEPAIRGDPAKSPEINHACVFRAGCQGISGLGLLPKEAHRFCYCLAGGGFTSLEYLIRAILSRRQGKSSNILLLLQAIPWPIAVAGPALRARIQC